MYFKQCTNLVKEGELLLDFLILRATGGSLWFPGNQTKLSSSQNIMIKSLLNMRIRVQQPIKDTTFPIWHMLTDEDCQALTNEDLVKKENILSIEHKGLWPCYLISLATCWDPFCISSKSGKLWLWVPNMQGVEVQLHNWMESLQFHSKVLRHQSVETACHYFSKKTSIRESGYFSTACSGKKAHLKPAVEMQNPLSYTLAVEKKPVTTSPGNTGQIFAYILMNFCIS